MRRLGNHAYNRRVVFQDDGVDFRRAFQNNVSRANWSSAKLNYLRKRLDMCEQSSYLMENRYIPDGRNCQRCGGKMRLVRDQTNQHGCLWRCYNRISVNKKAKKECRQTAAITKNSWFDRAKLSKMEVIEFAYRWWNR